MADGSFTRSVYMGVDRAAEVARRKEAMEKAAKERREERIREREERMVRAHQQQKAQEFDRIRKNKQHELQRQKAVLDRRYAELEKSNAKKAKILERVHQSASRVAQPSKKPYVFGSSTPRELGFLNQANKLQTANQSRTSTSSERPTSRLGTGSIGVTPRLASSSTRLPSRVVPAAKQTNQPNASSAAAARTATSTTAAAVSSNVMTQSVLGSFSGANRHTSSAAAVKSTFATKKSPNLMTQSVYGNMNGVAPPKSSLGAAKFTMAKKPVVLPARTNLAPKKTNDSNARGVDQAVVTPIKSSTPNAGLLLETPPPPGLLPESQPKVKQEIDAEPQSPTMVAADTDLVFNSQTPSARSDTTVLQGELQSPTMVATDTDLVFNSQTPSARSDTTVLQGDVTQKIAEMLQSPGFGDMAFIGDETTSSNATQPDYYHDLILFTDNNDHAINGMEEREHQPLPPTQQEESHHPTEHHITLNGNGGYKKTDQEVRGGEEDETFDETDSGINEEDISNKPQSPKHHHHHHTSVLTSEMQQPANTSPLQPSTGVTSPIVPIILEVEAERENRQKKLQEILANARK